jgi:cytochrome c oxidase subunit 2
VTRDTYTHLFDIYWPIGVGVGLVVVVIVLFTAWQHRASRVGDHWPEPGKDKNTPLELAYAAVIAGVAATLLYFTYSTMDDLDAAGRERPGETIEVTAAKWNWRFHYPDYGITSQGTEAHLATLTVPADTLIRFRQTSLDVIHSFFIPHERFKRDAFPGRTTTWMMSFDSEAIGNHPRWGECAEFCGQYHSNMQFNVNVLAREDVARWVEENRRP